MALSTVLAFGEGEVDGAVHRFDLERLRSLGRIDAPGATDEFGTTVLDRFVATAPGAEGGGQILFVSEDEVVSSMSAAELGGDEVARLGEDWADLGHPPSAESALVFGAPGEPEEGNAARTATTPAAIIVEYIGRRFTREVGRVTGKPGSMFGWRVVATDSRFPEASFNGAFVVSAPHENRGKKKLRAGAVYAFDTESGRRLWRFRSKRAGELAGYSLAAIQDQDDDGFADILVGAPGSRATVDGAGSRAPQIPGRVYLLSGRTGRVLEQIEAPEGAVLFGYAVSHGSAITALPGLLISAPATPKGNKDAVGAVFTFEDFDADPERLDGRRRGQWFGISLAQSSTHLFVGSFERHPKESRDGRGSVTAFLPSGRKARTLRGNSGGEYFGRALAVGAALAIGAPGAPPVISPE